jgi:hypothetical protein
VFKEMGSEQDYLSECEGKMIEMVNVLTAFSMDHSCGVYACLLNPEKLVLKKILALGWEVTKETPFPS